MNNSPISVRQQRHSKQNQRLNDCSQQSMELDIELYSEGWFDGLCNLKSTKPHIEDYWQGYQLGLRE